MRQVINLGFINCILLFLCSFLHLLLFFPPFFSLFWHKMSLMFYFLLPPPPHTHTHSEFSLVQNSSGIWHGDVYCKLMKLIRNVCNLSLKKQHLCKLNVIT